MTWPLLTSLQLAKEYALTGDRIPAERAAQIGLVNHVCPDDEVLDQAMACAQRIAKLPQQAVEDTKRILNIHLERAVLATLDFAAHRRGPLVHLTRAAGQPRPPPRHATDSRSWAWNPRQRRYPERGPWVRGGAGRGARWVASRSLAEVRRVSVRAAPSSSSSTRTRRT